MIKIKLWLPFAFLNHNTNGYFWENQPWHVTLKGKSKNYMYNQQTLNDFSQLQNLLSLAR